MQRLTIYLKKVKKDKSIIKNTISKIVHNQKEIDHHLSMNHGNILKHQITNLK